MSGKKNTLAKKIMSLIQEGKIAIDKLKIKSKAVLFLGMTRVGKSTLINYLNDLQLEAVWDEGELKLQVKNSEQNSVVMKISHSDNLSCTKCPGVVSPEDKPFSYIDMPGFDDTGEKEIRSVEQDIANAYFRYDITKKTQQLKMVLVVNPEDLKRGAKAFLKSLEDLSRFLQGCNESDVEKIKNTISIVFTAAKKDSEEFIECKLQNFINASPELSQSMKEILQYILNKKHYAVFTAPTALEDKASDEASVIRDLIENKTTFISKEDAKLAVKVSDKNASKVMQALNDLDVFSEKLAESINKDITKNLKAAFVGGRESVEKLKTKCEEVKGYTSVRILKTFFKDMRGKLKFSEETLKAFEEFNELLTFLVDLLPEEDRGKYTYTKNWIDELGLDAILTSHVATATEMLSAPKANFVEGKLTISGYHIKTSQVDEEIKKHTGITSIEIRALHTITIDNDLADTNEKCKGKLHGVNLSMFSPNIKVEGNKKIDLSGKDGEADKVTKASDGDSGFNGPSVQPGNAGNNGTSGEKGTDGLPGESGGSAGNLFIVCDAFPDRENLSVVLKGGDGAAGQNGGDGGNGGNGSNALWAELVILNHSWGIPTIQGWTDIAGTSYKDNGNWHYPKELKGGQGGNGGNGGKGGKGGDKGKQGQCFFIVGNKAVDVKKLVVSDGKIGESGKAGEPGNGGTAGRYALGTWVVEGKKGRWSNATVKQPQYFNCNDINNGAKPTALNEEGWSESTKSASQNLLCILLSYKLLLIQQATKYPGVVDDCLNAFKKHCEEIEVADLKATTQDLLGEVNALEVYVAQHGGTINFIPFYYSLLARVKTFALDSARTPEEIKVLEYLYVAVLGSIARINAAEDNLLITDIHGYVKNLVDKDFAILQKFQAKELQEYYRKQYQENVESKIDEAQSFLEILKKDVGSRQAEIAPKIKLLIEEVERLEQDAGIQLSTLRAKKQELEEALHKKMVFGVIGIAVQGIGMMFPPAGPIVAGVVNAGLSMASDPSFETVSSFATKVVEMKSQLGNLSKGNEAKKHEEDLFKKVQEMAKTVAPLIKDAKALLGQKSEGDERLKQLDDQIASVDKYIQELDVYLKTVPTALKDYLEGMVQEVQTFQAALQDKSLVALDFSKLEIKRFFANMKHNIKAVVGKFESTEGFTDLAAKMEEAIEVSVNICSRVQDYRDHIAFANYIAHLQTAAVTGVKVGDAYQSSVSQLELKLQQNIVQEAYNRGIAAIKQWAFPFAEKFLSAIKDLKTTDYKIMAENLQAMMQRIEEYKTSIMVIDQAITLSEFNTKTSCGPFFTWSYESCSQKIEALLKGKKVIFYADVCQQKLEAIKFKRIGIELGGTLPDGKPVEIKEALEGFKVTLTHSGISNYQFGSNFYQVSSDKPLEISCSFDLSSDGEPTSYTVAWKKINEGVISLSPYTTWIIQIEPIQSAMKTPKDLFMQLRTIMPYIKINLIGSGSYVDSLRVMSDPQLSDYYHQIEDEALEERARVVQKVSSKAPVVMQSVFHGSQKANFDVSVASEEEMPEPKNQNSYCNKYAAIGLAALATGLGFFALTTRGDICSGIAEGLCESIKNNIL